MCTNNVMIYERLQNDRHYSIKKTVIDDKLLKQYF